MTPLDHDRQLAQQVRQVLDLGVEHIDTRFTERLGAARANALAHQRVAKPSDGRGRATWALVAVSPWLRTVAMAFALSVGAVGTYYWDLYQQAAENEIIDSALLADELPPGAYLDRGFQAWLDRASNAPSP